MSVFIAIDLKSFYASAECVARGLDPLTTRLVVADLSRTDKTICLAVSPALKAMGLPGRARLFEVNRKLADYRGPRPPKSPIGSSGPETTVATVNGIDYLIAPPRMSHYMEVSKRIVGIYLRYVSEEDMHVYSVDEVFIDATEYLRIYRTSAHDFTRMLIREVLKETGITATAGIGTNLYLAKIAMDIEAKHSEADADGVRIAELDEMSYRRKYWSHRPLTDFWRVGRGISARLEANGICTMGDIARCSLGGPQLKKSEDLLYRLFGVNAELLIDHAWGREDCTMADIKAYRAEGHSLSSGQVLSRAYSRSEARTVILEMADMLVLDLVEKRLVTDQIVLNIGYDKGAFVHGSRRLGRMSSSTELITKATAELFDSITDDSHTIRRMYVIANHITPESQIEPTLDLFDEQAADSRERSRQEAILAIKKKFGKNAILKGMNFEEGATAKERNRQIGGHKA